MKAGNTISRLIRVWQTRKRRKAIEEIRVKRSLSGKFDSDVRNLIISRGKNPNCPYEQLAVSWELAAEAWKRCS
jgi:hypothetical protein